MAAIVVRPAREEDLEGYFDVSALTYNEGNPIPEERRQFKFAQPYVALLDGEVNGGFAVLNYSVTRGDSEVACGGVASVAVYPHRRRSGIGTSMMAWAPRYLRETGTPLASLYAYREPFYRRAGYEVVGRRLRITCPVHLLPKRSSNLPIRRLRPTDWREIDGCYQRFAHVRSGLCVRTEKLWGRVLGENRPLTIYAVGDPVEAYAVVSHTVNFWTTDNISDVAWCSKAGYEGLFEVFAGLGINKTALSWLEPSDGPFYSHYLDHGVEVKVDRAVMFRVCDVPAALRCLRPDSSGEFRFAVYDGIVPENAGPWRVVFAPDGVHVEPTDRFDFDLSIQAFTQAFMGEPSLAELARNDQFQVRETAGLAAAARLLTPLSVACNDFF